MKIQREISYLMPAGQGFPGTIINGSMFTHTKKAKAVENLRFTIRADPLPNDPLHDYRARLDYWGGENEDMLGDLYRLLGSEVVKLTDEHGNILPDQLHLLEGKRVLFDITLQAKPGHDTEFRKVTNLRPLVEEKVLRIAA